MEQNTQQNIQQQNNFPRRNREWTGIFLVIVGGLLLADKMHAGLPGWLFTWPMLLIGIGLLTGFQHRFKNASWFIMVIIGGAFLVDQQYQDVNLHDMIWPAILIFIGLAFIFRRRHHNWEKQRWKKWDNDWKQQGNYYGANQHNGEFVDSTNIFGGTKKVILSKNFKGGDITCFFGGAEIDLTQADIQGPVRLDVTQVFGGTKITVPAHWDVKNEMTAVFGGIEDKRTIVSTTFDPNKVLIIDGTSVFAGIEIRN
ncbi:MAG TPA: LiaF domain-containing protein [Chitinophagaceae bacterium]|nr:LiaF domain-containing protein [Chitinophagaceae bacterium]